ncbi:hypothetical protein GCM10008967_36330 [Bacillus carboniphilus]|uniref:Dehydrogenase n=1 Tax=Bacillus carboniphilus TaxID=86663 RepID=A0ABP3GE76_9BACI
MSSTIKMGVIGLGAFGKNIIKPISFLHSKDEITVTAVCDVNATVAEEVAKHHDIPHWYHSHHDMLSEMDLDLIYIATPPATHKKILNDVMDQGIHVLCEKPLANSILEAKNMWMKAEQTNVIHALHFGQNYLPPIKKFHQMVKDGFLGDLKRISLTMHYPNWPPEWQQNSWISTREQGGFLLEQGIHLIQAIQRMFGRITHVQSEVHYPSVDECENNVIARMKLETGETILIDGVSGVAGEENVSLTAYGTKGTITFKNFRTLLAGSTGEPLMELELEHPSEHPWILKHIIDAIHGKAADIYDFSKGYEAQVVLDVLRKAENKWVDLSSYYKHVEDIKI